MPESLDDPPVSVVGRQENQPQIPEHPGTIARPILHPLPIFGRARCGFRNIEVNSVNIAHKFSGDRITGTPAEGMGATFCSASSSIFVVASMLDKHIRSCAQFISLEARHRTFRP